jgi:uncharacterized protein (TIGR03437 family)
VSKKELCENLLSRRNTLRLMGAAGASALIGIGNEPGSLLLPEIEAASLTPALHTSKALHTALFSAKKKTAIIKPVQTVSCVTRPALTEGPFFVDELLNRSDIRPDPSNATVKAGTPLKVKFIVYRTDGSACTPLPGALVDLWHCDATGGYSDVSGQGNPNNLGQKFLRGYLVTDSNGVAEFTTIYPGWYQGRTVHLHYKVRLFAGAMRTYQIISQVCFDDSLTDTVFTASPYSARPNRSTRNSNDMIYQQGGASLLLNVTSDGSSGYQTTYEIGVSGLPSTVTPASTTSAASYLTTALTTEGVAALFGTGLALGTQAASSTPLPTTLGGVEVKVRDALGITRNAPLFFVSPTQVNFQIPASTSTGNAFIYVVSNGTTAGQGVVTISSVAPSLFSANASGAGVAAVYVLRVKTGNVQTTEAAIQYDAAQSRFVAVPIDLGASSDVVYAVLFGSGIRNRSSLSAVTCTIGGVAAEVTFAAAQGDLTGVDQVNVIIPRSLAGRNGATDLVLTVDGKVANTLSLSIR